MPTGKQLVTQKTTSKPTPSQPTKLETDKHKGKHVSFIENPEPHPAIFTATKSQMSRTMVNQESSTKKRMSYNE